MDVKILLAKPGEKYLVKTLKSHERVVLSISEDATLSIINDKCPHRGGPLHLCHIDFDGKRTCPWHGSEIKMERKSTIIAASYLKSKCMLNVVRNDAVSNTDILLISKLT
jgi:hypothetical protein